MRRSGSYFKRGNRYMFGVKSKYFLDDVCCNSCGDTNVIRIKRHRMCFNHFVFTIWLLIPVAYIYKQNNSYAWLLYSFIFLFLINGVIQFFRILKYRKREKREWLLFCLSCKEMGLANIENNNEVDIYNF